MKIKLLDLVFVAVVACISITAYLYVQNQKPKGMLIGVPDGKAAKFTVTKKGDSVLLSTDSIQNFVIEPIR